MTQHYDRASLLKAAEICEKRAVLRHGWDKHGDAAAILAFAATLPERPDNGELVKTLNVIADDYFGLHPSHVKMACREAALALSGAPAQGEGKV